MSYKTWRTIEMTLDPKSIAQAVKEIEACQRQLRDALEALVRELAKQGAEVAKMQVASFDAVDSGELYGSIYGYYDPDSRIGYVIAGAPHAFYVEYGTGIWGQLNPHPEAAQAGWEYDVNGHGAQGWYYDATTDGDNVFSGQNKYRWTRGMVSRPYMYNTFIWLQEAAEALGRTIFT